MREKAEQDGAVGQWCDARLEIVACTPAHAAQSERPGGEWVVCPCCQRAWPANAMDEDGCGICDECLAP